MWGKQICSFYLIAKLNYTILYYFDDKQQEQAYSCKLRYKNQIVKD